MTKACQFERVGAAIRCPVCKTERITDQDPALYFRPCGPELRSASAAAVKSRGMGDAVAKVLGWLGIEKQPGCGCGARQAWLNRVFPF